PVLDAGIEIIAGPPGKDPRSITLLSGGERTLTAVGLLFSLFKARPAPVAILDEVDAALDESNIERFCNLLSEFVGKSQFLIVTHSKRTMSYADIIFGVTMEESGVSKRVGIRLEEYEERVA
ncbi:MAG: AAA family ATPase, partial [Ignavibacteriae bacterium]|nr:chromosome segregation protein SMC [Ignavibacteriota bacterium]NOH00440.1 AAA family ATPase [Ignavibacteriota bacterium]